MPCPEGVTDGGPGVQGFTSTSSGKLQYLRTGTVLSRTVGNVVNSNFNINLPVLNDYARILKHV